MIIAAENILKQFIVVAFIAFLTLKHFLQRPNVMGLWIYMGFQLFQWALFLADKSEFLFAHHSIEYSNTCRFTLNDSQT